MPYWDQWRTPVDALLKASEGNLSFSDLIAQHNESRKLFPRLLFMGVAFLTGWDIRYEFAIIFLTACLIAYQVYILSQITIRCSRYERLALSLLSNLLIFSPVQLENWLWGIQLVAFIPIACITSGLVISCSNLNVKVKTLVLICLCTISTYSYANGMLSWFIIFPSAILLDLLSQNRELKNQRWLLLGGALGCIVSVASYFHNYVKPSYHPSFSEALTHPFDATRFFLIFLGTPLGNYEVVVAQFVGLILTVLFGGICFYLFQHRVDRQLLKASIPWLAIGFYTVISALVTTGGRLGFGVQAAMISRYTTFSLYLIVSLIYLLKIVIQNAVKNRYIQKYSKPGIAPGIIFSLVIVFSILHILTCESSITSMNANHRQRLYGKACLLFINLVNEESAIRTTILPYYDEAKFKANKLNQFHLVKPALVESPDILLLADKQHDSSGISGYLDSVTRLNEKEILASGWAIFPDRKQPADAVVLAYETSKGNLKAFAIAAVLNDSPDIAQQLKYEGYRNVRWSKTFSVDKLPEGNIKLSAWGFDTETRHVFQLENIKQFRR